MSESDSRAGRHDWLVHPDNRATRTFRWPAVLTGRTFEANLGAAALEVAVTGTDVTVTATKAQVQALGGWSRSWALTETTGEATERIVGQFIPDPDGTDNQDDTVSVMVDEVVVEVVVVGEPGPAGEGGGGGGAPSGPAGGVLGGTYPNPGFAVDMATQAELNAEAALARNADNLTGGTVADARIAATIARDSEVTTAVAAEATARDAAVEAHRADTTNVHGIADTANLVLTNDARLSDARTPTAHATSHQDGGTDELALDGSQITTGTVADTRIASTIARDSEVSAAVAAHEADTTNVHGIADTSVLETTSGAQAKADAKVTQTITNGVTTSAPSQDAVFDALAAEVSRADGAYVGLTGDQTVAGVKTFSSAPAVPADVYDSSWNGLQEPAPKDALWDALGAVSAYVKTLLDDADAAAFLTTLGISAFVQTLLDDANAGAARTTLGVAIGTDVAAQNVTIPADKTADYTLVIGDVSSSIGVDSATAKNVTVPANSSVAFPVGTLVEVRQVGAGQVTIVASGGVTLRSAGSALKIRAQYGAVSLLKVATDTWSVQGDLTA